MEPAGRRSRQYDIYDVFLLIICNGAGGIIYRPFVSSAFSPVAYPDSLDWKDISTQQIVERVTRNVKNGSIILFHNNAEHVLEYLPLILTSLKENGYEFVKINDMIYHEDYYIDERGCQISNKGKVEADEQ